MSRIGKNTKGYTIPLDKRLAADGRGLQDIQINDNFSKLADALYTTERVARDEVEQRTLMQRKVEQKEKAKAEQLLKEMAQRAREERSGFARPRASVPAAAAYASDPESDDAGDTAPARSVPPQVSGTRADDKNRATQQKELDDAYREREKVRRERQKERERDLRLSRMGTDTKAKYMSRMEERDVSERIALGLAQPTKQTGEAMYDARLFNQSQGLSSGLVRDDGKILLCCHCISRC